MPGEKAENTSGATRTASPIKQKPGPIVIAPTTLATSNSLLTRSADASASPTSPMSSGSSLSPSTSPDTSPEGTPNRSVSSRSPIRNPPASAVPINGQESPPHGGSSPRDDFKLPIAAYKTTDLSFDVVTSAAQSNALMDFKLPVAASYQLATTLLEIYEANKKNEKLANFPEDAVLRTFSHISRDTIATMAFANVNKKSKTWQHIPGELLEEVKHEISNSHVLLFYPNKLFTTMSAGLKEVKDDFVSQNCFHVEKLAELKKDNPKLYHLGRLAKQAPNRAPANVSGSSVFITLCLKVTNATGAINEDTLKLEPNADLLTHVREFIQLGVNQIKVVTFYDDISIPLEDSPQQLGVTRIGYWAFKKWEEIYKPQITKLLSELSKPRNMVETVSMYELMTTHKYQVAAERYTAALQANKHQLQLQTIDETVKYLNRKKPALQPTLPADAAAPVSTGAQAIDLKTEEPIMNQGDNSMLAALRIGGIPPIQTPNQDPLNTSEENPSPLSRYVKLTPEDVVNTAIRAFMSDRQRTPEEFADFTVQLAYKVGKAQYPRRRSPEAASHALKPSNDHKSAPTSTLAAAAPKPAAIATTSRGHDASASAATPAATSPRSANSNGRRNSNNKKPLAAPVQNPAAAAPAPKAPLIFLTPPPAERSRMAVDSQSSALSTSASGAVMSSTSSQMASSHIADVNLAARPSSNTAALFSHSAAKAAAAAAAASSPAAVAETQPAISPATPKLTSTLT